MLDGWGLAPEGPGNAVSLAHTPVFDELWNSYPHTLGLGQPEAMTGKSLIGD